MFYLVIKKFMIKKNSVLKIQNLVVNHESQPVKLNSVVTNLSFSPNIISAFLRKPLLVRNGSITFQKSLLV